ncbi:hypothetical protein SAMN02949497_3673 [Methylomagnum ishizawai]|uniref:DUF2281 domain-containing protein n=1 Tax=Methylomagnum ishizawai TaxID=1760988 RepID=A0A1Y6D017_9GAMM|nr:hypothetical protein [Methylomagnum ishizawai]SMF96279.1 hypothetical protein SAMN02949497_3673 [Methylomagnum ishizawai]
MSSVAERVYEITRNLPESKAAEVLRFAEALQAEPEAGESDFFALAGLWQGRDIDAAALRRKAWPERSR